MENKTGFEKGYIVIINLITIAAIVIGSLVHVGGWIAGGIGRGIFHAESGSAGSAGETQVFENAEIGSVTAELDMGELNLVSGDDFSVNCYGYPAGKEPNVTQNGTVLSIEQNNGWSFTNSAPKNCGVTLTIPDGVYPSMNLTLDMGSMLCDKVQLGDVTIDNDMGSVTVKESETSELNIDANMGEIDVKDTVFTDGDFNADMGSITLKDVEFTSAECDADMGSIEVSGDFEKLTAECNMGSVRVDTENENAQVSLSADMGDVRYNGENYGRTYSR